MLKVNFLSNVQTQNFTGWLAGLINNTHLDFRYEDGVYRTLEEARSLYAWPPKTTDINTPLGRKSLIRGASLSANTDLLDLLSAGLRNSLIRGFDSETADWIQAILIWGGVYTKTKTGKGNAGWLDDYRLHGGLGDYLTRTVKILNDAENDDIGETISNLRSNAGLTKIYSLCCNNFVIYDSRVAASLSWLISKYFQSTKLVPEHLRFATMRANTSKKKGKERTADEAVFPYFAASGLPPSHVKHLRWNIRANWLLEDAVNKNNAGNNCSLLTIRDLEASLFVIGNNLHYSTKFN